MVDKIKPIKGYEGLYSISEDGKVFSHIKNRFKKTYKSNYEYVRLVKNGIEKHKSIHRLVAENFIPNPNNLPVVDHIDNNPFNNCVENLQWLTQKENIHKSYGTLSQVRNFIECKLYKGNKFIKQFHSIRECCLYCQTIGLSYATMIRYRKCKDYIIKV